MGEYKELASDEDGRAPRLAALKAAIPHMEPDMGKKASLAVKLYEIKIIIDSFEIGAAAQASSTDGAARFREALTALRPYLDEDTARLADFLEKWFEMRKIAEMMNTMSSFSSDGNREE